MDTSPKQEIESLKRQLDQARNETKLVSFGFIVGAIATGYLAQWFFKSSHVDSSTLLPLIGVGCAMAGALCTSLYVLGSRLRTYLQLRHRQRERLEQNFSQTN